MSVRRVLEAVIGQQIKEVYGDDPEISPHLEPMAERLVTAAEAICEITDALGPDVARKCIRHISNLLEEGHIAGYSAFVVEIERAAAAAGVPATRQ